MTPEQRQAARERCEAAVDKWKRTLDFGAEYHTPFDIHIYADGQKIGCFYGLNREANATFAAHARTDLPAALDHIDVAEERLIDMQEQRDSWRDTAGEFEKRLRALAEEARYTKRTLERKVDAMQAAIEKRCAGCPEYGHCDAADCPLYECREAQ